MKENYIDVTKIDWTIPQYRLDYSKIINRDQKDLDVYNRKFELWDLAVKSKKITHGPIILLLEDPTIYMYALFNVRHRWYQDMIISDNYRFKIFCAANQIGKSFLLNTGAIYTFLKDHGHPFNRAIISASLPLAKYQMSRIKNLLEQGNIDWKAEKGDTDNVQMISYNHVDDKGKYKYTNYLLCAPHTASGALGFDLHEIDLDEFDFWDVDTKEFFYQVIQPRTYETEGKINIYSNPNGKENTLFEFWNQKDDKGVYKWHRYQFNIWDKGGMTQDKFKKLTLGMTRRQIESTLLAEFTDMEGSYFSNDEIADSEDKDLNKWSALGKQTFCMLDVGAVKDASVFSVCYLEPDHKEPDIIHAYFPIIKVYPVGYPLYRLVGVSSDNEEDDGWDYEKSVSEYLNELASSGTAPVFGCDTQSNKAMIPLFHQAGIYPEEVPFSGPSKFAYYQKAKYYFEKRLIHRIPSKEFVTQFSGIEAKRSQRGYLMFHHKDDSIHDDVPDSVVGALWLATEGSTDIGLTVVAQDGKTINSNSKEYSQQIKDIKDNNTTTDTRKVLGQVTQTRDEYMERQNKLKRYDGWI